MGAGRGAGGGGVGGQEGKNLTRLHGVTVQGFDELRKG